MKIISCSTNQTIDAAIKLAKELTGGEIIELNGALGSGKTVFAKGIARGLGVTTEIVSPTFSILNIYNGRLKLCHYDCYRIGDSSEAADSGLDEYFNLKNHVCVIEWAENIRPILEGYKTIVVNLKYLDENTREIEIVDTNTASQRSGL